MILKGCVGPNGDALFGVKDDHHTIQPLQWFVQTVDG